MPAAIGALNLGFTMSAGDAAPEHATHIFIGKISKFDFERRKQLWLTQVAAAKLKGQVALIDYTDHHLIAGSLLSSFYLEVLPLIDIIIVPTHHLKSSLEIDSAITQPIFVIEEPIECSLIPPTVRSIPERRDATLWFGHESNLPFLLHFLQRWPESAPRQLHIIGSKKALELLNNSGVAAPRPIDITFHEWTVTKVEEVSHIVSTCIIPSATSSYKSFASANRLVTSLSLGLPTLASLIPSYSEFSQFFCELDAGYDEHFFTFPENFHVDIEHFQQDVLARFSQEKIAHEWAALFSKSMVRI